MTRGSEKKARGTPLIGKIVLAMKQRKRRKKVKTTQRKPSDTFAYNVAPLCGLFVFVCMVGYKNYLLSFRESEMSLVHNFKREAPARYEREVAVAEDLTTLPTSQIPARLRGVYEMKDTGEDDRGDTMEESEQIFHPDLSHNIEIHQHKKYAKVQIYTPTEREKLLATRVMKRRYEDRKKLLLERCNDSIQSIWDDSTQLIAVPESNFTVCVVQKAGSTSWHKLVYELRMPNQSWHKSGRHPNRDVARDLPDKTKQEIMHSYHATRVITVRHPFARLISGWHNKFHKDFVHKESFMNHFGEYLGRHEPEEDHVIAFQDFVQYIADKGLESMDVHFMSIEQLCGPCQFPYDYIVRAETVLDDLWYVLDRINTTMDSFKKHTVSTNSTSDESGEGTALELWKREIETIKSFFETVPRETIEKLMALYWDDFEKFGYTFDLETHIIGNIID